MTPLQAAEYRDAIARTRLEAERQRHAEAASAYRAAHPATNTARARRIRAAICAESPIDQAGHAAAVARMLR